MTFGDGRDRSIGQRSVTIFMVDPEEQPVIPIPKIQMEGTGSVSMFSLYFVVPRRTTKYGPSRGSHRNKEVLWWGFGISPILSVWVGCQSATVSLTKWLREWLLDLDWRRLDADLLISM